jgi:hypothetical protein
MDTTNPQWSIYAPHMHTGYRSEWARNVRALWAAKFARDRSEALDEQQFRHPFPPEMLRAWDDKAGAVVSTDPDCLCEVSLGDDALCPLHGDAVRDLAAGDWVQFKRDIAEGRFS